MQGSLLRTSISSAWKNEVVPALQTYVRIPALSPSFDSAWQSHGHIARAVTLLADWAKQLELPNTTVRTNELPGMTPVIVVEVAAYGMRTNSDQPTEAHHSESTVLLYGHLDKQPEMEGWLAGLGPWEPVITDNKLYGRGGADDGYALFASLTAVRALQRSGGSHARLVLVIEASEESGSPDLGKHIEALAPTIGNVDLVVCLDSGCATYDRLWTTTSLRGLASVRFTVRVLTEGVHSGAAGGIVPSSFRIARLLLDRLENPVTGECVLPDLRVQIPTEVTAAAQQTADLLGVDWAQRNYPWVTSACGHASNADTHTADHLLDRTWKPALEVTGADGLPATAKAGNVLRPHTTLSIALRLPPTLEAEKAIAAVREALTTDVPFGATVEVESEAAQGWAAPPLADWLADTLETASMSAYGRSHRSMGEGGTIPFMGMLAVRFPNAQFAVAGVLGPGSNAHGPNEFLHLDFAERLTVAVAHILHQHTQAREASPRSPRSSESARKVISS